MAHAGGRIAGIVLAAGQGSRMGTPKALLRRPDGTSYLSAACEVLHAAGCSPLIAVLGASGAEAATRLPPREVLPVQVVVNDDWSRGMSTSLRTGLRALEDLAVIEAALIHLVDLPDIGENVLRRIIAAGEAADGGLAGALVRAQYSRFPGHPVLIGRNHWAGVVESAVADAGARTYLRKHRPALVDVSDLATGRDLDTPTERLTFEEEYRA